MAVISRNSLLACAQVHSVSSVSDYAFGDSSLLRVPFMHVLTIYNNKGTADNGAHEHKNNEIL